MLPEHLPYSQLPYYQKWKDYTLPLDILGFDSALDTKPETVYNEPELLLTTPKEEVVVKPLTQKEQEWLDYTEVFDFG